LAAHKAIQDQGIDSPYTDWLDRWEVDGFDRVTTQVHVADYFERRDAALLAHATQVDPAGMWFAFPRDIERKIWPTEDFELAVSNIERIEQEDDLFAGLR
jgi:mycothiol S-conjugate amidase